MIYAAEMYSMGALMDGILLVESIVYLLLQCTRKSVTPVFTANPVVVVKACPQTGGAREARLALWLSKGGVKSSEI